MGIPTRACYGCKKFSGFKGRVDENLQEINRLGNEEIGTRENTARKKQLLCFEKMHLLKGPRHST